MSLSARSCSNGSATCNVRLGEYDRGDLSYSTASRLLRTNPLVVARIGLKRARSAARTGAYGVSLRRLRRVAEALDGVPGVGRRDLRVEMQMSIAFTQFRQGRLAAARVSCQYVIDHGHARRTPDVVADALAIIDVVEVNLGHPVDGRSARRALRLHERRGDLAGQARVLTQIGYRAYFDGRWDDAVDVLHARPANSFERLGDSSNVAVANGNIAEILLDQGRLEDAEVALREAIRVWRASGSENDVAFGRALLGRVLARQGRYDEADVCCSRPGTRFVEQGAKMDVIDADVYQAECLLLARRARRSAGSGRGVIGRRRPAVRPAGAGTVAVPGDRRVPRPARQRAGRRRRLRARADGGQAAWRRARGRVHGRGHGAARDARAGQTFDRALARRGAARCSAGSDWSSTSRLSKRCRSRRLTHRRRSRERPSVRRSVAVIA